MRNAVSLDFLVMFDLFSFYLFLDSIHRELKKIM